jgi:hypothetical protein
MASDIDICNDALALCGQGVSLLVSLDAPTQEARVCRQFFDKSAREVLRLGVFRCARRRADLSQFSEAPPFGFAFQYQLPADFLRAVGLNGHDCSHGWHDKAPLFEVEGDRLLTDARQARLVYVSDLVKTGRLHEADPLLCKCVSLALAGKICWSLNQNRSLRESILAEFEAALREARSVSNRDAFEHVVPAFSASDSPVFLGRYVGA